MNNAAESWVAFRRKLHSRPEIAGEEAGTAHEVAAQLDVMPGMRVHTGWGGNGVVGTLTCGVEGPSVLFRAELDALPLQENRGRAHGSQIPGKAHLCGHDGHATMLLAAASKLSHHPPFRGTIHFLFQPAEETGEGARAVLQDPRWSQLHVQHIFALHNLPGYPSGQVVLRKGRFNADVRSMIIRLKGATAHASEPWQGINPAGAVARVLSVKSELEEPDMQRDDFALIVPVYGTLGTRAYGTSAGEAELHFTLRTWDPLLLDHLGDRLTEMVQSIARENSLECSVEWTECFDAMVNDDQSVAEVEMAARKAGLSVIMAETPFSWGEDFGQFLSLFRGAFFGLGAGHDVAPLHHPDYDFPDALIENGCQLWVQLAYQILGPPMSN